MNKWELTKDWIAHLKGMQIAELEPDPQTKKIKYRRQPKIEDLYTFLANKTDFEKEDIVNAIKMMLSKSGSAPQLNAPTQQGQKAQQPSRSPQIQQPSQVTSRPAAERIKEDFVDDPGREISEKEVELVFDMLISLAGQTATKTSQESPDRTQDLKRIKNHIRTQLTPDEIMGLWRNLKNA